MEPDDRRISGGIRPALREMMFQVPVEKRSMGRMQEGAAFLFSTMPPSRIDLSNLPRGRPEPSKKTLDVPPICIYYSIHRLLLWILLPFWTLNSDSCILPSTES